GWDHEGDDGVCVSLNEGQAPICLLIRPKIKVGNRNLSKCIESNEQTPAPYNPLFTSMYKSNLIAPSFSLAISRPTPHLADGYLALGGLTPIVGTGPWVNVPLEYVQIGAGYLNNSLPWPQYQFHTITPDAFLYQAHRSGRASLNMGPSTNKYQVIIDSDTTLIYMPPAIADAVAALYTPPGVWNDTIGGYSVPCNAKVPDFAVKIGGVAFPIDARDMVLSDFAGTGGCIAGNVVIVFDVGGAKIGFRARGTY
ncbi:putative aspartic-type endopeptidase, partial [Lachnellula suecica]